MSAPFTDDDVRFMNMALKEAEAAAAMDAEMSAAGGGADVDMVGEDDDDL